MRTLPAASTDRTIVLLVALYVCWGSAIPAMKLMVETVPPLAGAALVFLLGGLVLGLAARGRPVPTRAQVRRMALAGILLLVGGQGLATVALTEVTASFGAILAATIPLWVVVLSGLVGTPVSRASKVRLAAGFGGIAIVVLTAPNSAIGGARHRSRRRCSCSSSTRSRASCSTPACSPARRRRSSAPTPT